MEGMQEVGGRLKTERERQERSLADVYQATHITTRYLEALEKGAFEVIPGEVYLKGFLRRYAQFLGLDGEELVRAYLATRAEVEGPAAPPSGEGAPPRHPARARTGVPGSALRVALAVSVVALAAVATGWAVALWSVRTSAPAVKSRVPARVPAPVPPVILETPETTLTPAPPTPAPPAAAVEVAAPVRVSVRLVDRCWFRVVADGRIIYEGELASGAEAAWTAQERLSVRFGNPQGVRLSWNGWSVPLEGDNPLTRLFTREGVAVPPSPAPAVAAPATPAEPAPPPAPPAELPPGETTAPTPGPVTP